MKIRLFSLLLAFALLINFSGVHALALELGTAMAHTASMPSHGGAGKSDAHSDCAMHAHVDATTTNHVCDESAKKSHVCGLLECDCGCHMSALTFTAISLAVASHAAKLSAFQPQRAPLPPVELSLRPPISA
jgi:hypothetical protein